MAPFIFMERNGIHVIDLNKTLVQLREAMHALKTMARDGKRILFVATKKQARSIVQQEAQRVGMPYVTERWLGGTLTNFVTIRRLLKKMASFDKLMRSPAYQNMTKKEQLMIARENTKLERLLRGISDTTRLPAALFIVDLKREHIAVKEARKLGIPVFALADTNADPTWIDYPISGNDDSSRAVSLIIKAVIDAIADGLEERNKHKAQEVPTSTAQKSGISKSPRARNAEKVSLIESTEKAPVATQETNITPTTSSSPTTEKRVTRTTRKTTVSKSTPKKQPSKAVDTAVEERITAVEDARPDAEK